VKRIVTDLQKERLYFICYKSKQGSRLSFEEERFLAEMHKKFPKDYRIVSNKAREQAVADYTSMWGS